MNIKVIVNNLDEAKVMSTVACRQALNMWGQAFENHAKDYAPVDTGRLQNSIKHERVDDETEAVQTNVEYAVYQEMGTSRQKGTPFMRPAGMNHLAEYKKIIESALK